MKYGNMILSVETVSPNLAKSWLEKNETNRNLRKKSVSQYASDMISKNWVEKPVAICFNQDGKLANGQHTLNAIIQSGKEQSLLIAKNVPTQSIAMMDIGVKRTITDIGKMVGNEINSRVTALTSILIGGVTNPNTNYSFHQHLDCYQKYQDEIDFVLSKTNKSKGFPATLLSVCVKLISGGVDKNSIERFLEIIKTGEMTYQYDKSAIKLRDFLLTSHLGGNAAREDAFKKVQYALDNYLNKKPINRLLPIASGIFNS